VDQLDQLLTIAEISVALAGFAGVVATFQFRQNNRVTRGQAISLSMIVNISLVGAFFAALPIGLINAGLDEPRVWSVSSLLMGINQFLFAAYLYRNSALGSLGPLVRKLYVLFFIISTGIGISLLMNGLGLIFNKVFAPIFFTFLFNFALVGFTFSRLLMYPLWKSVRENIRSHEQ